MKLLWNGTLNRKKCAFTALKITYTEKQTMTPHGCQPHVTATVTRLGLPDILFNFPLQTAREKIQLFVESSPFFFERFYNNVLSKVSNTKIYLTNWKKNEEKKKIILYKHFKLSLQKTFKWGNGLLPWTVEHVS